MSSIPILQVHESNTSCSVFKTSKRIAGRRKGRHCSKMPTWQSTRVYPTKTTSSQKDIREGPLEGSSGFHESTTQRHPNIDGGLPPRGRLRYYIVESGQESMAEFNQWFHFLYLTWKLLLAANNMSKKSTLVPRINYVISRHQDEHAERPLCQKSRYNPGMTQEATATTSTPLGASSMLNAARKPAQRPS
ncbi:hypothetical protein DY000_02017321 [Brassica cretica]|uniref:Uncharacterized protein n=1 Tax=Brassica cretica TaxID=69181 RepID=A0ABQ7CVB3_BRACR|nr:hypothetical protein DY000_02017321 [Brassica cretica]